MQQEVEKANLETILRKEKVSQDTLTSLRENAEKTVTVLPVSEFIELVRTEQKNMFCIDVRSESEYGSGHLPGAFSVPLLSDSERHTVGLCFSKNGFGPAMASGMRAVRKKLDLLRDEMKRLSQVETSCERMKNTTPPWQPKPKVGVYCFRGRMRSRCIAWWFQQLGYDVVVLEGGYKKYREWALSVYEKGPPICVVGGRTGSGKTRILHALRAQGEQILDLEGLANHRGSSFGWIAQLDQPSSEQFQNIVASEWIELDHRKWVYIEDEASNVGTCTVPPMLYQLVRLAPLIIKVVLSIEARVNLLLDDYTNKDARSTNDYLPRLRASIENMSKRLGAVKTKQVLEKFDAGDASSVILDLILHYDKLYDKHVANSTGNGSGTGEREGVIVTVEAPPTAQFLDEHEIARQMKDKATAHNHLAVMR